MNGILRGASMVCLLLTICGCASFSGDNLISLTTKSDYPLTENFFSDTQNALTDLYQRLKLPRQRQLPVEPVADYEIIQHGSDVTFAHLFDAVILIDGKVKVANCYRCIVIASGDVDISHGGKNVIVTDGNVSIGHDNAGSLIVARQDVSISFAYDSTIDAHGRVDISHRQNVFIYAR